MADTAIEWAEMVSRRRYGLVELGDSARRGPALVRQALKLVFVEPSNPQHRVGVLLPAIAGLTGGDQVSGHGQSSPADRDEVIERLRGVGAVGAALRQHLVPPPRRDAAHSSTRLTATSRWPARVILPFPLLPMCPANSLAHVASRCPGVAPPAPRQPKDRLRSSLRLCRTVAYRRAAADRAGCAETVGPGRIGTEFSVAVPLPAAVAPLLAGCTPCPVVLHRHADSLCGYCLNSSLTAHAVNSSVGV